MKNVKNRSKFHEKWPFFAIILPQMASYGSKTSFLLIFSAKDDLVKGENRMPGSAKTNLPLLTLTSWVKEAPPFHDWARYDGDGLTPCSRSEVGCREEKGIVVYDSAAVDGQ